MRLLLRGALAGVVLLACLVCCVPLRVSAAENTVVDVTFHVLTEQELAFLEVGGDASTLALPAEALVLPGYLAAPVEWEYGAFDSATPGLKELRGKLVEPEGYTFHKNGAPTILYVKQEIIVHGAGSEIPLYLGQPPPIMGSSLLLPVGSSRQELDALLASSLKEQAMLMTEGGSIYFTDYTVDTAKVNPGTRGAYWPYTIDMPPGTVLKDPRCDGLAIYVVDPGRVELALTARLQNGNSEVYSSWLYEAQDAVLEYVAMEELPAKIDEAPWAEHVRSTADSTYAVIDLTDFKAGTYFFRIRHREGVSDILKVVTDGVYDPDITGGDLDGGDTGRQDVPDLEQKAPTSGTEAGGEDIPAGGQAATPPGRGGAGRSGAGTVTERATAVQTAVSGLRLREMMTLQPGGVLFQKGPLSVWLDNAMLSALNLADDDLLDVQLEMTGPGRFRFEVWLNGEPLAELPGTRAQLEYTPPSTENLACASAEGHLARELSYNEETGVLSMVLDAPGRYAVTSDEPSGDEPVRDAITGGALPVAGPPSSGIGPLQISLLAIGAALAAFVGFVGQRIWRSRQRAPGVRE